jgi:hypothetical protein
MVQYAARRNFKKILFKIVTTDYTDLYALRFTNLLFSIFHHGLFFSYRLHGLNRLTLMNLNDFTFNFFYDFEEHSDDH